VLPLQRHTYYKTQEEKQPQKTYNRNMTLIPMQTLVKAKNDESKCLLKRGWFGTSAGTEFQRNGEFMKNVVLLPV